MQTFMLIGIGIIEILLILIMLLLGRMASFSRPLVSWGTPVPLLLTLVVLLLWHEQMIQSVYHPFVLDAEVITMILAVCGGILAIVCAFFVSRIAYAGTALLGLSGCCAVFYRFCVLGYAKPGGMIGYGCYFLTLAFGCMGITMKKSVRTNDKSEKGEDEMEVSEKDYIKIIWTVTEGLLALLLCVTPMMSFGAYGYTYHISYLTLLGSILSVGSVTGLSMLGEDGVGLCIFYTIVITAIIVCCVVMAVNVWKGRGRILYLIGNGLAFILVIFVLVAVRAWTSNGLISDSGILRMGIGYWFSLLLSVAGFAFGVLNFLNKSGYERDAGVPIRLKMPWGNTTRHGDKGTGMSGTTSAGSWEETDAEERMYRTYREPDTGYTETRHVKKPAWEDAPESSTMNSAKTRSGTSGYRSDKKDSWSDHYASFENSDSGRVSGADAEEKIPSVKVKYNIRNHGEAQTDSDEDGSGFFYRDDDLA
ncbi:MAG: hypothetical protein LUH53_09715 [Lachnospiraceae bacterium]|nr:hypothetical protein [Lachnospiraceae bacterium]